MFLHFQYQLKVIQLQLEGEVVDLQIDQGLKFRKLFNFFKYNVCRWWSSWRK